MRRSALNLPQKVVAIHDALQAGRIPHAFGGALALAYYAEPRATIDVDVNVFVPPRDHPAVAAALEPLGVVAGDGTQVLRDGQDRWVWEETYVDLFFSNAEIHDAMAEAVRLVPFGETRIPILAPEHLIACKVAFDRPKDWLDIEQVALLTHDLDRAEVLRWVDVLTGPADPRRARLEKLMPTG